MEASAAPGSHARARPRPVSSRLLRLASDDRLVEQVRRGSQPAFEVIFDRHHRGILAFCRHMLGSREEAEDAVQHTFMAAYRDLVGSDKPIQLRAWLYTIARNRCLTVLRRRREQPAEEVDAVATEGLADEVQRRADLQDLLRDLSALPEDQRAALVLSELGDLPHDEIANVIGCRREKVKALVFQARSSLQASREARNLDCAAVRELVSTLRGGALRRTPLRRHLAECAGCRAFKDEVDRQRRAMAVLLPVIPSAGLKADVIGALFGSAGAAGAGAAAGAAGAAGVAAGSGAVASGTTAATSGVTAVVAKTLVVAAAVGGGTAGVKAVTSSTPAKDRPAVVERQDGTPVRAPEGPGGGVAPAGAPGAEQRPARDRTARGRSKDARGHTDRGKDFARTRGKGLKRGLEGTQPGRPATPGAGGSNGRGPAEAPGRDRGRGKAIGPAKARGKGHAKPHPNPHGKPVKPERPAPPRKPVKTPRPEPTPAAAIPTVEPTVAPSLTVEGHRGQGRGVVETVTP